MTAMHHDLLSLAQLILFAVFSLRVVFVLVHRRSSGWLGWLYLLSFCLLQIVLGVMNMNPFKFWTPAHIIANVALTPLLLAAGGILQEARAYRITILNKKVESGVAVLFHLVVILATAFLVIGLLSGEDLDHDMADIHFAVGGSILLTVSWLVLVAGAAATFCSHAAVVASPAYKAGTTLLSSVSVALVFIGIHILYTLAALVSVKPYLNSIGGIPAVRLFLGLLPDILALLALVFAGVKTPTISRINKRRRIATHKYGDSRNLTD